MRRLCYVPSYKHLGTYLTSKHSLDQEIATRLGIAHSAFAEISRPILCNKRIPPQRRVQLFQALICSKFFFGLGAWTTPSNRQLQRLKGALRRMLKKVLKIPPDAGIPPLLVHRLGLTGFLEPRAKLAVDRLLYAQRLWEHGPPFVQRLLLREDMITADSWLAGLKADIAWLWQLVEPPNPFWATHDLTDLIDFWQSGNRGWKKLVKQAWRRYVMQEAMIHEAEAYHCQIFSLLKSHQADFEGDIAGRLQLDEAMMTHECDQCSRCFSSAVGLATHRRKSHGLFSLEHDRMMFAQLA